MDTLSAPESTDPRTQDPKERPDGTRIEGPEAPREPSASDRAALEKLIQDVERLKAEVERIIRALRRTTPLEHRG